MDNDSQPIEDAYKSEANSAEMQEGFTGFTSSDRYGMYSFSALPSGVYDIKIT